jgi:hypothetical protein
MSHVIFLNIGKNGIDDIRHNLQRYCHDCPDAVIEQIYLIILEVINQKSTRVCIRYLDKHYDIHLKL